MWLRKYLLHEMKKMNSNVKASGACGPVKKRVENGVVVYCVSSSPFSGTKTSFTEKSFWTLFLSFLCR